MLNQSSRILITLAPEKISVGYIKKNRVVQSEQLCLDRSNWESAWSDGLTSFDQPIRQLLSRFSLKRFPPVTVLYHSPNLIQQTVVSDLNERESKEFAHQKIREIVGFANPIESCVLDRASTKSGQTTTLVFSDREEHLRSLFALFNRCKLNVRSFVPKSVAINQAVADQARKCDTDTAVFYIDADVSVMAFSNEDGLQLIRNAEIGYAKLVEGYVHALSDNQSSGLTEQSDQCESQSDEACIEQAKKLNENGIHDLFTYGIPIDQVTLNNIDLRAKVLPVLSPVLQRFCVEIKQTIRFGLGDIQAPSKLIVTGPGASIPHIHRVFAEHIDMHIAIAPDQEGVSPVQAFSSGSIEHCIRDHPEFAHGLLPQIAKENNTRRALNRALAAGLGLALLAIGGEYANVTYTKANLISQIQADSYQLEQVNTFNDQIDTISSTSELISQISGLVTKAIPGVPNWDKALVSISDNTNDAMRINEIRGEYSGSTPIIEISGYTVHSEDLNPRSSLNEFIKAMKSSDGVTNITLGATSRIDIGKNQWGQKFTMKILLVREPVPHERMANIDLENQMESP